MFRGNIPAKIDPKSRLKLPAHFRKIVVDNFGNRVFVTSLNGDCVRIYPFPVWEEIEQKLSTTPTMKPEKIKFIDLTNYWGQETDVDSQGRVAIHQHLREAAKVAGLVAVMGRIQYLEIWNVSKFCKEKIEERAFTEQDLEALALLGI